MAKAAILGYGVVGSGVYEILCGNSENIEKKAGQRIDVKYILDLRDFPDHPHQELFTKDFNDILNDDEVSVVIEVMGGVNPAYDFSKAALLKGKNVITSNKELVAACGTELMAIAKENSVNYLFEASVGGGIPIIRPLNQCMAANRVEEIYGILNGTTNYIMTKMAKEGADFDEVLKEAQRLGYAERNPEADVCGHDACRKIAILSSLASGKFVDYKNIPTEGITEITRADVKFASKLSSVIKLIGSARLFDDGKVFARVAPMIVPESHQFASVNGVFNAILLHGDYVGDVMFYGRGAGKLPTASAVVADVIDAVKHIRTNKWQEWIDKGSEFMVDASKVAYRYFVRTKDASLGKEFANAQSLGEIDGEYGFVTEEMQEGEFLQQLSQRGTFIRML
ncbi:MAG: homoserine dehydrogenase [Ruminococcaceae bacterium]|nr:homoserine dehydrogenase [Oscillospiraceae bacterium]